MYIEIFKEVEIQENLNMKKGGGKSGGKGTERVHEKVHEKV